MKKLLLPVVLTFLLIQSCVNSGLDDDNARPNTLPRSLTADEEVLIELGNAFSFNIFRRVAANDADKNVFISPLSISMALGMTLNGAKGETAAGIKETLDMREMELQAINKSYQSLIKLLVELDPKVEMRIGNSLWGRKGFAINPAFKDTLKTYFNARVDSLDFSDPAAADVINDWVNDQTNGRIEKIIDEIPDDLLLYLVNTVYFKGDWLAQFDPEDTNKEDFKLEDGSTVEVNMMSRETDLATFRSDKVQMADLAYGDSLYNMTILMPADPAVPINDFIQESLTAANLADWTGRLQTGESMLKMPKFETSYEKELNDILAAMGMDEAFSDIRADFSNINPDKRLVISEVKHKANITVNEEGSEAAAVTSVGITLTSAPPSFVADRPFVYIIRERISGTVLFTGVMRNPGN
jgi:serpin B